MHHGTFPSRPVADLSNPAPYTRSAPLLNEPEPAVQRGVDRRTAIIGVLGLGLGAAGLRAWQGASGVSFADERESQPARPTWIAEMLELDPDKLIERAGDFERRSRRANDPSCIVGFERLLQVASKSRHEYAALATACALRTLGRFDRSDLVETWLDGDHDLRFAPAVKEAKEIVREANLLKKRH